MAETARKRVQFMGPYLINEGMAWLASSIRATALRALAGLNRQRAEVGALGCYRALVAQARQPQLFAELQVPDTPQGRFESVLLHACLVMRRLGTQPSDRPAFSQNLFDLMFADFDIGLRELGVGDLGVGKRVHAWAAAFRGRAAVYAAGLRGDEDLTAVLQRNVYLTPVPEAASLAAYMRRCDSALGLQDADAIAVGTIAWPQIIEETHDARY